VKDSRGCSAVSSSTISQPVALFVTLAQSADVLCKGDSSGSVDITVSGGVPKYSFVWNTGDTLEDLAKLVGGIYAVTVTDLNGCQKTFSHTVSEPAQVLTVVLSKTDATCNGAADGTASAAVTGGTSPYTYLWSNNSTTNSISGLSAGAYFVTVKDANGCSVVQSISIGQPLPFVVSGTVTDVNCKGQSTGSINVSVTPAGVYTFTWSSPSATGQNPTGLAAGTYTVTVNLTSNPGCTVSKTFTIAEPASVLGVNLAGFDSVKCAGSNNGFIDITVTGGTPSYTYSWTKNGSAYATTEDLANLSTGSYALTITDSKGCTTTLSQVISNPIPITSSIVKTDLKCFGDHSGAATLTVTGGEAPYTYLWSNFNGSKDLSQLSGGLYTVVITDANGCEKRDSANIIEPTPLVLSTQVTNISCHNANDGAIDLTVSGGTPLSGNPKYTYTWAHGPATEDISGLSQANYAVTVKDANLCSAATSVLIVNPPSINSVVVITNPLCNAANGSNTGGAISVGVSGGTPGYTYTWSANANGSTTSTVNNVTGGVYYVTITDSRSCTKVDSAVLIEPDPIVYNVFIKNVSCKDNRDGFLDITAYGGTVPYSFLWSNGNLTEDVGNIPGGNYTVSITDRNNCTAQGFFQVKEPDSLKVSITKTDATCQGANTGSVHAVVTGGTLQYNYLWNNFSFDSLQNNIPGGTYSVVVTDSNKCQVSASVVVNGQPSPMALTKSASNPKCVGADNGFVSVVVSGGAQPYTYNWNTATPQTGNMATSLPAGTYVVTVTDKVGCSATETTQLVDPLPIVVSTSGSSQVSCANSNDGIVIVNVGGGKSPYIYQFDGFAQASDTFRNISPGTYSVLVRDANGCESTSVATIASVSQLAVDLTSDKEVILVSQPVQLTATATSDTTIKNYVWTPISASFDFSGCTDSTNCNNPIARPHQTTTFVVTVVDARGCTATDTLKVEVSNDNSYFFPTAFTPNGDGLNDFFEFDVLGAVSFDVNIWNRWGEKVFSNPNQKNGIVQSAANGAWDGMFRGKKAQFDTYTYQIVVKYFDGTTENKAGTITVMQ
jgi:gliding motility-associated-like protein